MTTKRKQVLATIIATADGLPPLALAAHLPFTDMGAAYSGRVTASGGAGSYSYSVTAKPAWMTATQVGQVLELSGTAGAPGSVTVTATDALLDSVTRTFYADTGGTIRPPKDPGYLPARPSGPILHRRHNGSNKAFSVQELLNAPTLPLTWGSPVGTLPPGMTWNAISGALVSFLGTSVAGEYLWSVPVTDAVGQSTTISIKIVVDDAITLTADLPDAIVGQPYAGRITAIGGAEPITITLSSGALPPGMQLLPDGTFASKAVPTAASAPDAASTFEVIATDALGAQSPPLACELRVTSGMPSIGSGRFLTGALDGNGAPVDIDFFAWVFGDGQDGDYVCDGVNTHPAIVLTTVYGGVTAARAQRDCYFNNLTIEPGACFDPNGYTIYVAGTLDIAGASANAIATMRSVTSHPARFGGSYGAGGPGSTTSATVSGIGGDGESFRCGAGGKGGGNVSPPGTTNVGNGGRGASINVGGFGGLRGNFDLYRRPRSPFDHDLHFDRDVTEHRWYAESIVGGGGGAGGGGGGGSGSLAGANGGSGGTGGGMFRLYARTIHRDATTAAGAIAANGTDGSNGSNGAGSNCGGGGGGSGGGGGRILIFYLALTGAPKPDCVQCNGGKGGNGGNGGGGTALAGNGGNGGDGGSIGIFCIADPTTSTTVTGAAGGTYSGTTGGAGGTCKATL